MAKPPAGRPAQVPTPYLRRGSLKWQIKVTVPQGAGGRRGQIARSLGTEDHAEALSRAVIVACDIRKQIEARRRHADGTRIDRRGSPSDEQRATENWWAQHRVPDPAAAGTFMIPDDLEAKWEDDLDRRLGDPLNRDDGDPKGSEEFDPKRLASAEQLKAFVLTGQVRVASEVDRYIDQQGIKAAYASRTRRAVVALGAWLAHRPSGDHVDAVTGRAADEFAEHLAGQGITTATLNSLVSALSSYWRFMVQRSVTAENPWASKGRRVVRRDKNAEKRAFTNDEIKKLLGGSTTDTLHDMMRLAALTGMRLTEIGGLRVKGARAGVFQVETSKTRSGVRAVPVHSQLKALVARRVRGKQDADFLIEELTSPPSHGGARGKKVGEHFTAYRRGLGLDQRQEGRRQSDTDFHSFRRWFVTMAEQENQTEALVARVVGHKLPGFTFGTYSAGVTLEQSRAVVEAVKLPRGALVTSPRSQSASR